MYMYNVCSCRINLLFFLESTDQNSQYMKHEINHESLPQDFYILFKWPFNVTVFPFLILYKKN